MTWEQIAAHSCSCALAGRTNASSGRSRTAVQMDDATALHLTGRVGRFNARSGVIRLVKARTFAFMLLLPALSRLFFEFLLRSCGGIDSDLESPNPAMRTTKGPRNAQ